MRNVRDAHWVLSVHLYMCLNIASRPLALDRKTGTLLKISVRFSSPKASNVLIATNPRCSTCCYETEYPLKDIERLPPNRDYTSQFIFETFPSAHVRGTVWVHWMQLNPSFLSGWRWQSSPPSSSIFTGSLPAVKPLISDGDAHSKGFHVLAVIQHHPQWPQWLQASSCIRGAQVSNHWATPCLDW